MAISQNPDIETPLIEEESNTVKGFVDYKSRPAHRFTSGGWRSAYFIIGVEVAERFVYYGIYCNLISYLTGPLGQSTATAAENVNAWAGTATLLPLLGAFVADSFFGRYRTIVVASAIYILGLCLLTLSATLTSVSKSNDQNINNTYSSSPLEATLFFFSLYLVAIGQGGHKPSAQAFGADQFDGEDTKESKSRSSFFNWCYFGLSLGITISLLIVVYIQDNLSWCLGFGIPCIVMILALVVFLLGTGTYRYSLKRDKRNPFKRIGQVFVLAIRNRKATLSNINYQGDHGAVPQQNSEQFKFLNKALVAPNGSMEVKEACSLNDVHDAKALLRLIPIWVTSLAYAIVFAQATTFFTKQGATMDRTIIPGFKIPAASLQCFTGFAILLFVPIYDRIFVPMARAFTKKSSGITLLQRIGTGMLLSAISMVVAALVEMRRLKTAREYKLVDTPSATVPMSVWWLVPQYILFGIGDVFSIIGLQEFFYDQFPNDLKSVGISVYLSVMGIGSFLSSFLVSVIDKATSGDGHYSWFDSNLNRAHLDYFYWLLLGLDAFGFATYLYFAKSYVYYKENSS